MTERHELDAELLIDARRVAGPVRPVDAAAVWRAIDQRPRRWSRPSSVGFASAGVAAALVIVVLGAIAATGLLPDRTQEPLIGAARSDLLPGVDLEVDEVRPGVWRVLHDGFHGLRRDVTGVGVTDDGTVVVRKAGRRPDQGRILQLGSAGTARVDDMPLVERRRVCAAGPDPECWRIDSTDPRGSVTRIAADGTETTFRAVEDIGLPGLAVINDLEIDADGTVWVGGNGLASFDGAGWTLIDVPSEYPRRRFVGIEFDADGTLWGLQWSGSQVGERAGVALSRHGGDGWTTFPPTLLYEDGLELGSDGRLWVGLLTWFDGTGFRRIELASEGGDEPLVAASSARMHDGRFWIVAGDGKPEGNGLYLVDRRMAAAGS